MAPPSSSTTRRLLHSHRVPHPRRPLFPSIRPHRRHSKPLLPLHLSLSPPHNTSPPPSLQLSLASPSPQSMTDNGDFWWLHAQHAEPPTAWLRALLAEVCKRPIFMEAEKNKLKGGANQVFFLGATSEAVMPLSLWMDGAWKLAWIWTAWILDWIGALGCLAAMMDRLD